MGMGHRSDTEALVRELTGMPTPPGRPLRPMGSIDEAATYGIVMGPTGTWANHFAENGVSNAGALIADIASSSVRSPLLDSTYDLSS
jgi:hypothetical protein